MSFVVVHVFPEPNEVFLIDNIRRAIVILERDTKVKFEIVNESVNICAKCSGWKRTIILTLRYAYLFQCERNIQIVCVHENKANRIKNK